MSSTTKGLRRVGVTGVAALVAVGGFIGSATIAHAALADTGGQIGLVDTNTTADNGTQGATLVYPGIDGQALGDVKLLIPNSFKNGDTIDLAIYDRTATATSNGQINADTAHKLGFTAAPSVDVDAAPYTSDATLGATSGDSTDINNNPSDNRDKTDGKATTPPKFTAQLVQSSRANGLAKDIIRLTVNGVQAGGLDTDKWAVTLSGLKADLGSAVSPGELRVVPFAYNGTPSQTGSNASELFDGNVVDTDGVASTYDPTINAYTVPAYVAPVNFNVGAPNNIVADGTTQRVGDVTISETNNYSLQNGTYTLTVDGATVMNDTKSPVTVTTTNAATTPAETVTTDGVAVGGNAIKFTLDGASNTSKLSIKLSGLLLSDTSKGAITYRLTGGSIDGQGAGPVVLDAPSDSPNAFLVNAGDSGPIGGTPPNGVLADSAFSAGVNQTDIEAPELTVGANSTPIATRIGGSDRYETAAKVALNNGENDFVVLASGENFPDALSSGYLAQRIGGGSILLTKQGSLPAVTADAMRLLGTRTVYVVGGANAVSDAVVKQLQNTPQYYAGGRQTIGQGKLQIIRLGGSDRYATNKAVNQYAAGLGGTAVGTTNITFGESSKLTALVATGDNYPDALAAGAATAGNGRGALPLILTKGSALSADAATQFTNLGIKQAVVVGGNDVVKDAVATSIGSLNGGVSIKRLAGDDRYATAAAVADFEVADATPTAKADGGLGFDRWGGSSQTAYLATGASFADALAGAPLAAGNASPILLTKTASLSDPTHTWLSAHGADYARVIALGLGSAVSQSTLDAANAAISGN